MHTLSTLLPLAGAISLAAATPKPVSMPIYRTETSGPRLRKRSAGAQQVGLDNFVAHGAYLVNATVGTPAQNIALQLDTGSSDCWMFDTQACQEVDCTGGSFDYQKSSTFKKAAGFPEFEIQYDTVGSFVRGVYFTDDYNLGGIHLTNFVMGLAAEAKATPQGIMGIGFETDETIFQQSRGNFSYPNAPAKMKALGIIPSVSYSLYLNDLDSSTGNIIFGGYDTKKYSDPLTVLEIVDSEEGIKNEFAVSWSYVGIMDGSGKTTLSGQKQFPLRAVLDSGTTLTRMPTAVFNPLAEYFGAVFSREAQAYLVDCNIAKWQGSVVYGFADGAANIQVPFSELALPVRPGSPPPTGSNGEPICIFGLDTNPSNGDILLGDTFLRSAYVIYDQEAFQIAIAQTIFNSADSNVQPIASGTDLASILSGATAATTVTAVPSHSISNATMTPRTGMTSQISGVATTIPVKTTVLQGVTTTGAAPTSTSGAAAGTYPLVDRTSIWSSFLGAVFLGLFGL